ncbi:MAG: hypothetical protein PVJ67_02350 [Candidatus Pacearchaeota archaeon]|jgi:hypothetical protein
MLKNKRGWMKIVEAFVSILLIVGVLLMVINKGYIGRDLSTEIYDAQLSILRGVQVDETLRNNILVSNRSSYSPLLNESSLPIPWEEFDNNGERILQGVRDRIIEQTPEYLNCTARICELEDPCLLEGSLDGEIYTQAITIVANYAVFSPRQLKLFCYVK